MNAAATAPAAPVPAEVEDLVRSSDTDSIYSQRDRAREAIERRIRFRGRFSFLFPVAIVGMASLLALFSPASAWTMVLIVTITTLYIIVPAKPAILITFFLAMAIDNPNGIPGAGNYRPPLIFIGEAIYKNLEPLPLCLLDLLAGACLLRGLFHFRTESKARIQRERVFARVMSIALVSLTIGLIWGLSRGGDLKQAVYQTRTMFYMPCFGIAISVLGDLEFLRRLKTVLLMAAAAKGLTSIYPYFWVEAKDPLRPMEYVTIHADSMLYSMAFAVILASWIANVNKRLRRGHAVVMFLTLMGLYMNQRRIAFVSMAFAMILMYLDAPTWRRAQVNKLISRWMPVFILYMALAVSGVSNNVVFRPGLSLRGIVIQQEEDTSSQTRDIENYNLWATYRPNPILGTGFGHKYDELVVAAFIGDVFPQYRNLPHNSFLGLFAFGGMVVAVSFYSIFPATMYLALRAAKRRVSPEKWSYAIFGCSGIVAMLVQAFGDVGLHDPTVGVYAGVAVGVCGALYCMNDPKKLPKGALVDARTAVKLTT